MSVDALVDHLFRRSAGRMIAVLTRVLGPARLDLAEEVVQDALDTLIEGRTTFVIAHRLSTIVDADRILVLHGGGIIECGSHDELLRDNGYYASLVGRQTRRLIA